MQKQHHLNLVDGTFSAEDAHHVLDTLLAAKIKFHRGRKFGHDERGTVDHLHCDERLAQLRAARAELADFINDLTEEGHTLEITSRVDIRVLPKQTEALAKEELASATA